MNVHKTFRRRPWRLLNVLCMFNLRPVSTDGAVWQSELVHLGEPVRIPIIQSFIFRGVYCFTEPSEGMIGFWN